MIRQNDQTGGTQGAISVYADAANFFYQKINGNGGNLNCKSMAGQFYYYFFDSDAPVDLSSCSGFVSLPKSLEEIYSNTAPGSGLNSQLYFLELYYESEGKNLRNHYSAYTPGEQTGANSANTYDSLGSFTNPFLGSTYQSLRNFYSTKLVSMQSLFPNTEQSYGSSGIIPLMSEGSLQDITGQTSFNNPLVLEQENIKDIFQ